MVWWPLKMLAARWHGAVSSPGRMLFFGSNCTICGQILARRKPGGGLLAHCLAFCSALRAYHQGEEAGLFAELLRPGPAFLMLRGSWLMIIR
jgi:hypothetical protein